MWQQVAIQCALELPHLPVGSRISSAKGSDSRMDTWPVENGRQQFLDEPENMCRKT